MQKEEFLLEVESKKNAMKYFPNFFGSDCSILSNKTLKELREEYLKYCEKYFTILDPVVDFDKIGIKKAYDYMKNMLEKREMTYYIKSKITKQVLAAYEHLITALSDYGFIALWENSCGAKQNQTNRQILFEISLLKPMLIMVLENIDLHFEKICSVTEVSTFDNELREELENLVEKLYAAHGEFIKAERDYHDTWDSAKRRSYCGRYATDSDLGKAKARWKSTRNSACRVILDFYRQIREINMSLQPQNMVHTLEQANEIYNYGIENITSGPNYYSYLSEEDRKSLTEQNTLKKQKLKNKQN